MNIAPFIEAQFGRTISGEAALALREEIRRKCGDLTQAEVKEAIRVLAERTVDQANRRLPTAPEIIREIWQARKAPKVGSFETIEEAMLALVDEPDLNIRWSMLVHRGCSKNLMDAVRHSKLTYTPWDKDNPELAWTIALMQDPEYIAASRELFDESERQTRDTESGAEKNKRRDRHARKHWALYYATRDARAASGWTPPPVPARTVNPVAFAILDGLNTLSSGALEKFKGAGL